MTRQIGEDHHSAKLTENLVRGMRTMAAAGWKYAAIQNALVVEHGIVIGRAAVHRACIGETWAHVPGAVDRRVMSYREVMQRFQE